jgi:hypothetical protein
VQQSERLGRSERSRQRQKQLKPHGSGQRCARARTCVCLSVDATGRGGEGRGGFVMCFWCLTCPPVHCPLHPCPRLVLPSSLDPYPQPQPPPRHRSRPRPPSSTHPSPPPQAKELAERFSLTAAFDGPAVAHVRVQPAAAEATAAGGGGGVGDRAGAAGGGGEGALLTWHMQWLCCQAGACVRQLREAIATGGCGRHEASLACESALRLHAVLGWKEQSHENIVGWPHLSQPQCSSRRPHSPSRPLWQNNPPTHQTRTDTHPPPHASPSMQASASSTEQ